VESIRSILRSYITFTRKERNGIIALVVIITVLLAIYTALPYVVQPYKASVDDIKLQQAYNIWVTAQCNGAATDTLGHSLVGNKQTERININTADSLVLVGINGIGAKTAHKILEYRRLHGDFKNSNEIRNISGLQHNLYLKISELFFVADTSSQK